MFAKKSLGQNFLTSKKVIFDMVDVSEIGDKDTVLEVGPGKGVLTEVLLEKAFKVLAIEKDDRLIPILEEKFKKEIKSGKLILIHSDVFDFNPKKYKLDSIKYKIVANIPYYITGEFLRFFLENKFQPSLMTLLVQKEVAMRICARDKKESILSISVKIYGEPKYIEKVPAKFFKPKPKVDSAVIKIDKIKNDFKDKSEVEEFFKILKFGFAHKRKFLSANLKEGIGSDKKELIENTMNSCGLAPKSRAEDLTLENWICLFSKLKYV